MRQDSSFDILKKGESSTRLHTYDLPYHDLLTVLSTVASRAQRVVPVRVCLPPCGSRVTTPPLLLLLLLPPPQKSKREILFENRGLATHFDRWSCGPSKKRGGKGVWLGRWFQLGLPRGARMAPLAVRPRRFWLVRCRKGRPCPAACLQEAGQRQMCVSDSSGYSAR